MSYHRGVARDTLGNSLNDASVSVFDPGTTTESTLYSDVGQITALDNPFTTGTDGVYEFYVDPGYYDIQVAKSGFTTVTLTDQAIGTPFGYSYVATGGTATKDGSGHDIDNNWGTLIFSEGYPSNAFSLDVNGKLKYDGNPKVWALIRGTIVLQATVDIGFNPYFDVGGVPFSQISHKLQGTAEDQTISWSTVRQIETDDLIFFGCEFSNGPADVTIKQGTNMEVMILG